ncbi:hypothetical protein [Burkholderia sp. L27(2015)]|uniref:hypothetical protein n=1 Tax=Burkholderia sp. L27(2015) TaxID=1641858 RepID=UPI001C207CC4|nr:hypothetical protein [Burkholderia sp. L27(2015)]
MRVISGDVCIGQPVHPADVIGETPREDIAHRTARATLDNAGNEGCLRSAA